MEHNEPIAPKAAKPTDNGGCGFTPRSNKPLEYGFRCRGCGLAQKGYTTEDAVIEGALLHQRWCVRADLPFRHLGMFTFTRL